MIRQKLATVVWSALLVTLLLTTPLIEEPVRQFLFGVTPLSMLALPGDFWVGLGLTFTSAAVAWGVAVSLGHVLGIVAAATLTHEKIRATGRAIDIVYDGLYIVPLVLTLSLAYALAMFVVSSNQLPRQLVGVLLIGVSGLALGGYHVYKSVYQSTSLARRDSVCLARSLFFRPPKWSGVIDAISPRLREPGHLRDCEIERYASSLETAFHLSLVSVMILESITPSLYELILPQTGQSYSWLGGVGRMILTAQQSNQYQVIAGCIWATLLYDLCCTRSIGLYTHHRWLRHYQGRK